MGQYSKSPRVEKGGVRMRKKNLPEFALIKIFRAPSSVCPLFLISSQTFAASVSLAQCLARYHYRKRENSFRLSPTNIFI